MQKIILFVMLFSVISGISFSFVMAQEDSKIPPWIKTAVGFWVNGEITDDEFIDILKYFIQNDIIEVPSQTSNDKVLIENLHNYQTELNSKIERLQELVDFPQIQKSLKENNESFAKTGNPESVMKQIDDRWQESDPEKPNSISYNLIYNPTGDILRSVMDIDQKSESQFKFAEIFITNQYGANVAQSHKTSDFIQSDETWWQKSKQNGIFLSEGGFDESANVYAGEIGIKIVDENGNFIGVMKAVVNIESITSSTP